MSDSSSESPKPVANQPLYSFLTLVVFVAAALVLYLTNNDGKAGLFLLMIVSTAPSLVSAFSAERAARDIRNGLVRRKAKEGAAEAIAETGVVLRDGPVASAQLEALRLLLANVHASQTVNSAKLDTALEQQQEQQQEQQS